MHRPAAHIVLAGVFLLLEACSPAGPSRLYVDSGIEAELRQIRAIDNHAHPRKVIAAKKEDRDADALPADAIQDLAMPAPLQPSSPYFPEAWHALFSYQFSDTKPEHIAELQRTRSNLEQEKGDSYPVWVLNHLNTDIMLANRVSMGQGLTPDRFKWVPFVDMFLFPLNNGIAKAQDPEHKAFIGREEALLSGYLGAAQARRLPATFDDYLTFVSHMLENWKSQGAVALKFELAYLRDLSISNPQKESADRVYSIYAQSSEPTADEYKIVQDYIFRYIAREAGRLNLPVHIHTSIGAGSYFRDENANPFQMETLFNDPALRRTKFVMLHSSWPLTKEAAVLTLKPNVYVDLSGLSYFTYPAEEASVIRTFLEAAPEKVLYGSDASAMSSTIGWEETGWIASRNGRLALGLALTGMLRDGEITSERAQQLAHAVMRENARALYGF